MLLLFKFLLIAVLPRLTPLFSLTEATVAVIYFAAVYEFDPGDLLELRLITIAWVTLLVFV